MEIVIFDKCLLYMLRTAEQLSFEYLALIFCDFEIQDTISIIFNTIFPSSLIQSKPFLIIILACNSGAYGIECNSTCGFCLDGTRCSHVDGTCLNGCNPGFIGAMCRKRT